MTTGPCIDGHTPGPWFCEEIYALMDDPETTGRVNRFFASVQWCGAHGADRAEQLANAALIAAAPMLPEMADMLRILISRLGVYAWQAGFGDDLVNGDTAEARALLERYEGATGGIQSENELEARG